MVAMVLASDAEVVFLDEPTTGLDPFARREVWAAIRRAKRDRRTVLLTTHYLDEAEALSDRVALLEGGRRRSRGRPPRSATACDSPTGSPSSGGFTRSELEPYGEVSAYRERVHRLRAGEGGPGARARGPGPRGPGSLGPVSLEDIFLQIVGRPIDQDAPSEDGEPGAGG